MARSLWTEPEQLRLELSRAADAASYSGRKLMESAGLSWRSLSSWKSGDRTPLPENVRALGQALLLKGEKLSRLGSQLVEAAELEAERRRADADGDPDGHGLLSLFPTGNGASSGRDEGARPATGD